MIRMNNSVHAHMSKLADRIVAESRISSDRFHLGKMILQTLKDAPDFVLQIDGGTNESETNGSVLKRSVQCAVALKDLGLQKGDVMMLMAPNHLDLAIPYYAALYLGIIIAPVDRTLTVGELKETFKTDKLKIIFCQSDKVLDIQSALRELNMDVLIVTFDDGNVKLENTIGFSELLNKGKGMSVENFKAEDFNPDDTLAILVATSGTTGLPKQAGITQKNFVAAAPYKWSLFSNFPTPTRMTLVTSPLQWVSAIFQFNLSPIMRFTRLQTSLPSTQDHVYHMINTYKPTFMVGSPPFMTSLVKVAGSGKCDFTCFEVILIGGSAVPHQLIEDVKKLTPRTAVYGVYGASEVTTYFVFYSENPPPGSYGKLMENFQCRLVNYESGEDIVEPNVPGELWLKGSAVFKGYYNNRTATEDTFAEDGWFKTGDLFYRDEDQNYYFVDRIKSLLKYNNHQVAPVEVEAVILKHPGVLDVAVTGIPDPDCGDLIVACVVRRPGSSVTAQEIKDLVKESLTDTKQLRGGVIFLDEIPMTASTKVHRRKLKELVLQMDRE